MDRIKVSAVFVCDRCTKQVGFQTMLTYLQQNYMLLGWLSITFESYGWHKRFHRLNKSWKRTTGYQDMLVLLVTTKPIRPLRLS